MEQLVELLKDILILLILLVIVGTPSFFWVRWAFRAFKKKQRLEFIIAAFSSLLFMSGFAVMELSPRKYFKHDASESAIAIYEYFAFSFVFSISMVVLYFSAKGAFWIIKYLMSKNLTINCLGIERSSPPKGFFQTETKEENKE